MEANGIPEESSDPLPAARAEPGETEETPGRSFDSSQEAEEINLTLLEPIDPVNVPGGLRLILGWVRGP